MILACSFFQLDESPAMADLILGDVCGSLHCGWVVMLQDPNSSLRVENRLRRDELRLLKGSPMWEWALRPEAASVPRAIKVLDPLAFDACASIPAQLLGNCPSNIQTTNTRIIHHEPRPAIDIHHEPERRERRGRGWLGRAKTERQGDARYPQVGPR